MYILGISCFYHDSAACLIKNGEILYAIQEERLSRIKHDSSFPINSISQILKKENIKLSEVEKIIFYEKPFLKFERIIETYIAFAPKGIKSFLKAISVWIKDKLFQKYNMFNELKSIDPSFKDIDKILFSEHHLSHAASAFYPSNFSKSAILTLDAVGEWATTSIAIGSENEIEIKEEINYPHSLGLIYSAFTYFCGFKVNGGEYKLMGLAPYGRPIYKEKILENLIKINSDGSFILNMSYFDYCTGFTMTNENFNELFGSKPRKNDELISQFHMDLASSIQEVLEEIILKICRYIKDKYAVENLCLAGGVALNCVAIGKIIKQKIFKEIWIQPAAGDAGGSLGAALAYWFLEKKELRKLNLDIHEDKMKGSYLGFQNSQAEITKILNENKIEYTEMEYEEMIKFTAEYLSKGNAIGWFQNKMEFGPRALGSRSILADPRDKNMQKKLNLSVKFRESFRPFAPIILKSELSSWFDLDVESPYMGVVTKLRSNKIIFNEGFKNEKIELSNIHDTRSVVPAITHVDYSARIQTVDGKNNKEIFHLLKKFYEITNVPILVNTSFNLSNEPIVCDVLDAYKTFLVSDLDILVCGNCVIKKK